MRHSMAENNKNVFCILVLESHFLSQKTWTICSFKKFTLLLVLKGKLHYSTPLLLKLQWASSLDDVMTTKQQWQAIHQLNLERLNLEWDFCPNELNPEWDWAPNGRNPEWTQPRMGLNPEWDWTSNGLNPEWTQPRMDSTLNGLNLEWTLHRMGLNLEWTQHRMGWLNLEWTFHQSGTQHRMDLP